MKRRNKKEMAIGFINVVLFLLLSSMAYGDGVWTLYESEKQAMTVHLRELEESLYGQDRGSSPLNSTASDDRGALSLASPEESAAQNRLSEVISDQQSQENRGKRLEKSPFLFSKEKGNLGLPQPQDEDEGETSENTKDFLVLKTNPSRTDTGFIPIMPEEEAMREKPTPPSTASPAGHEETKKADEPGAAKPAPKVMPPLKSNDEMAPGGQEVQQVGTGLKPAPTAPLEEKAPITLSMNSDPRQRGPFTGLIIDAGQLGFEPLMEPEVISPDGKDIYSTLKVDKKFMLNAGMAGWSGSIEEAKSNGRAGSNPLLVKAIGVTPDKKLVIGLNDALNIMVADSQDNFLKKCRVIVVLN